MYDTRRQLHRRSNRNIPTTHIELDKSNKAQNVGSKTPSKVLLSIQQVCILFMLLHCRIIWNIPIALICLTSLTRAKCGTRSTLCWKVGNISSSTELFAL